MEINCEEMEAESKVDKMEVTSNEVENKPDEVNENKVKADENVISSNELEVNVEELNVKSDENEVKTEDDEMGVKADEVEELKNINDLMDSQFTESHSDLVQNYEVFIPKSLQDNEVNDPKDVLYLLQHYGPSFTTRSGLTLLHLVVSYPSVYTYVMVNNGVPVNVQNHDGNTALHLAIKRENMRTVEALLQCCADSSMRNKMGQTCVDMAEGSMKELLLKHEPGAVTAVLNGKTKSLARILPMFWTNVHVPVKNGLTLLELALAKAEENCSLEYSNCCRILHEYRPNSELIHAVLAEDTERLLEILQTTKGCSVNLRFRDRLGKTLLSHAVESNNLEVVKILTNAGAKINGIRVRDKSSDNSTMPLFQKAFDKNISKDIALFLYDQLDKNELREKDSRGNTVLLRAIDADLSTDVIQWILTIDDPDCITARNKKRLNAREMALSREREDIVEVIDQFILQQQGTSFFMKLPVAFYGIENLPFLNQSSDKVSMNGTTEINSENDKNALKYYSNIEEIGSLLFTAAAEGDLALVQKLNIALFQDKNGYTALIRAIVFNQIDVVQFLSRSYPDLKVKSDNSNISPLHYAYAMPDGQSEELVNTLLESKPDQLEKKSDKDGIFPAEYKQLRNTAPIQQMLSDARVLDAYGKKGPPLAFLPQGAYDFYYTSS